MRNSKFYVYILTNKAKNVLYTGITNNLIRRIYEHKNRLIKGFTSRYNVYNLVYFEEFDNSTLAITREKQIKGGSRKNKENLINKLNKNWNDLYEKIYYDTK